MEDSVYAHEPLDHSKPSIRLLHVKPDDSPAGLIQCTLFRSTTDTRYNCLSYAWGEPTPCYDILVNGKTMSVRQNLFDFLRETRRTKNFEKRLWIDAICIDQSNTAERNHQVQQMGSIYARAQCVLLWLGETPGLAPSMRMVRTQGRYASFSEEQKSLVRYHLLDNLYWGRAWITQEIGLARRIIVLSAGEAMPYSTLLRAMEADYSFSTGSLFADPSPMKLFASVSRELRGAPLTKLLAQFSTKQCSIPRDRIYSLLALCSEKDRFSVDYDLSELDLLVLVLKQCKDNFCFCTIMLLAQVLGLVTADIPDDHLNHRYPYIEFDIKPQAPPGSGLPQSYIYHCWEMGYHEDLQVAEYCGWTMVRTSEGKTMFVPMSTVSSEGLDLGWQGGAPQDLADGFELKEIRYRSGSYSLRMPLLVWVRWLRRPVTLCDRGMDDSLERRYGPGARIGYTTGAEGGEGFVGQVLPEQ